LWQHTLWFSSSFKRGKKKIEKKKKEKKAQNYLIVGAPGIAFHWGTLFCLMKSHEIS
jgi:putative flippase GtrA